MSGSVSGLELPREPPAKQHSRSGGCMGTPGPCVSACHPLSSPAAWPGTLGVAASSTLNRSCEMPFTSAVTAFTNKLPISTAAAASGTGRLTCLPRVNLDRPAVSSAEAVQTSPAIILSSLPIPLITLVDGLQPAAGHPGPSLGVVECYLPGGHPFLSPCRQTQPWRMHALHLHPSSLLASQQSAARHCAHTAPAQP